MKINFNLAEKKRLSVPLEFYCSIKTCEWTETFHTSKKIENNAKGMKPFEINYRSVLAMRETEKGYTALSTFCGSINIPGSMNKKCFPRYSRKT